MKFPAFEPIDLKNNMDGLEITSICITKVIPDENQPRKKFSDKSLEELGASIKKHGIIQPIIVKIFDRNQYKIIAGERRWRAAKLVGLMDIPVIIRNNNTQENIAVSLIENIQREELNPIELAEAFRVLSDNHGLSHEEIANMIGKSRATVSNILRLLNLSQTVRELLIHGAIEMGHARALLTLTDDQQCLLVQKIVKNNLTVRDTEKLVQLHKFPQEKKDSPYILEVNSWVKKLSNSLSSKVSVNINEGGDGKVTIHFSSPEEVDWLVEQLEHEK